jgi:hypothetical protein
MMREALKSKMTVIVKFLLDTIQILYYDSQRFLLKGDNNQ